MYILSKPTEKEKQSKKKELSHKYRSWLAKEMCKHPKSKRVPLITLTLGGIKYTRDWTHVAGTLYFNQASNLYGLRISFFYKDGHVQRLDSDCAMADPYKHLEHLIASCLTNLQKTFGGHITLEKYEESAKTKGFNSQFFKKLELAGVSPG